MVVGDELQSIYGFRHADLDVFREQRAAIAARAPTRETMELSGNFRSRPEVIGAVNAIGGGADRRGLPAAAGRRRARTAGAAGGDGPGGRAAADRRDGLGRGGSSTCEPATDADTPPTTWPRRASSPSGCASSPRPGVERGEMVVLLRAFTHLDAYEDSLERAGLRPYVVGGRGYWSQQQVADVCALLATIANPLDDQALFGALASPACAAAPGHPLAAARGGRAGRHVWPALERGRPGSARSSSSRARAPRADPGGGA